MGWAFAVALASWILGFFALFLVTGLIELRECGLDPYTEYESGKCASVSAWASVTAYGWLATPLVWVVVMVFLGLARDRWARARRVAGWCVPALPVCVLLAQVLVYLLYGPLPA
ncbi:hypothetical protein [Microtetraspora niveoalba]|uniref:hypothetical protein n=1 Tax=Microtetraspora niveoalba TaxID=46175 RepID=UPI000831BB13|nr:hypothetical protein [Microtetraspora niveoalba]